MTDAPDGARPGAVPTQLRHLAAMARWPLVLLAVAVMGLPACSSSDDGDGEVTVAAVADATRSADTARVRMEISFEDDAQSATTEGVVDLRSGDGLLQSQFSTSDAGARVLIVDGETFVGPSESIDDGPAWITFPQTDLAADEGPLTGVVFDPGTLVEKLQEGATSVKPDGTDEIRGESTTTYRLDFRSGSDVLSLLSIPKGASASGTMDVDGARRLRRLVVEPDESGFPTEDGREDDGRLRLPVPARATLELWDFGTEIKVERPDPSSVVDFDDPAGGELMSRIFGGVGMPDGDTEFPDLVEPTLAGPFARVASGSWEDVTWEVWEAPTEDDRVCRTFELTPPPSPDNGDHPPFPGTVYREDELASCGPRADLFRRGDPVQLLGGTLLTGDYFVLAGEVAPEITALEVVLDDGETLRVPVDPATKLFMHFSRKELELKQLRPDAGSRASIECDFEDDPGLPFLNCSGTVRR